MCKLINLCIMIFLLTIIGPDIYNGMFRRNLAVIAPVLTDQEYKELNAEWASMETIDDMRAINKQIERIAHSNGIRLPEP